MIVQASSICMLPNTCGGSVALLEDYVAGCLRGSADPRDAEAVAAVRAALPSIGYRLTTRGVQAAPSPVDRVLARSASKTDGAVEIVAAEGPDLAALRERYVSVTPLKLDRTDEAFSEALGAALK